MYFEKKATFTYEGAALTITPTQDGAGRPEYLIEYVSEHASYTGRELEAALRSVYDLIPDGIWDWQKEGFRMILQSYFDRDTESGDLFMTADLGGKFGQTWTVPVKCRINYPKREGGAFILFAEIGVNVYKEVLGSLNESKFLTDHPCFGAAFALHMAKEPRKKILKLTGVTTQATRKFERWDLWVRLIRWFELGKLAQANANDGYALANVLWAMCFKYKHRDSGPFNLQYKYAPSEGEPNAYQVVGLDQYFGLPAISLTVGGEERLFCIPAPLVVKDVFDEFLGEEVPKTERLYPPETDDECEEDEEDEPKPKVSLPGVREIFDGHWEAKSALSILERGALLNILEQLV